MTQQLGIFDPPPVKAYYPTTAPTAKQLVQRTNFVYQLKPQYK